MLNLVSLPVCEIAEAPARVVALAASSHIAAGIAALLLLGGIGMVAAARALRMLGQAMLFGGIAFGTLPLVSLLVTGTAECGNPELLARLARVAPVLSTLALGILAASAAGALFLLYRSLETRLRRRASASATTAHA